MDYFQKYTKYKEKYLNLKKLIGGEKYDIELIKTYQIKENENKWFIIRSEDNKTNTICKLIKFEEKVSESEDFINSSYLQTYTFEDINGNIVKHSKSQGYRDGGGSLNFCKVYIVKNLSSSIERDKIKVNDIISQLNTKYPVEDDYEDKFFE